MSNDLNSKLNIEIENVNCWLFHALAGIFHFPGCVYAKMHFRCDMENAKNFNVDINNFGNDAITAVIKSNTFFFPIFMYLIAFGGYM